MVVKGGSRVFRVITFRNLITVPLREVNVLNYLSAGCESYGPFLYPY